MPAARPVWAIDIGNNSLKALRLHLAGDKIEVIGLDYIEHPKVLSAEGITEEEREQTIRTSLNTFAMRNELSKNDIAISVAGQTSFARFIKLPPVEPKRVPEIVKFEAIQQIPFDINEVEWDWQLMPKADSPETEVGIFAIKNELISRHMDNFSAENIRVSLVQMAPMAMYNYAWFDRAELDDADKKAVVLLDMGADNTNLVVCTKSSVWQRCIPLGGNNFTKAIAEAFKLNFEKAEKLKRGAPMSKYARQIFHAMKPVFTDFGAEVQRSLGYYSNSHKETSFVKIILLGGGFKLQGLNKYLQQATQLSTLRPDSFEKLVASENVSSAKLHDNIADFGIVYGLGIQSLGAAKIESNLLPAKIARSMMWAQKSKFFIAAAVVLVVVSLLAFIKTNLDLKASDTRESQKYKNDTQAILQQAREATDNLNAENARDAGYEATINEYMDLFKYRDVLPTLNEVIFKTLPNAKNNSAQAELYAAYANGDVEKIKQFPRNERKQVFITSIGVNYADSLMAAPLDIQKLESSSSSTSSYSRSIRSPGREMGGEMGMGMDYMAPSGAGGEYGQPYGQPAPSPEGEAATEQDVAGFVVVIEGYSPYERIGELMDPAGVGSDEQKWGVITRMLNLDKVYDGNCPFSLYKKAKIQHFKLETGVVELQSSQQQAMPEGIGILEVKTRASQDETTTEARTSSSRFSRGSSATSDTADRITTETVLVDPLTKEEISKTFDLDEKGKKKYDSFGQPIYIERDRWFRIKAKFVWKDAPKAEMTQQY